MASSVAGAQPHVKRWSPQPGGHSRAARGYFLTVKGSFPTPVGASYVGTTICWNGRLSLRRSMVLSPWRRTVTALWWSSKPLPGWARLGCSRRRSPGPTQPTSLCSMPAAPSLNASSLSGWCASCSSLASRRPALRARGALRGRRRPLAATVSRYPRRCESVGRCNLRLPARSVLAAVESRCRACAAARSGRLAVGRRRLASLPGLHVAAPDGPARGAGACGAKR